MRRRAAATSAGGIEAAAAEPGLDLELDRQRPARVGTAAAARDDRRPAPAGRRRSTAIPTPRRVGRPSAAGIG